MVNQTSFKTSTIHVLKIENYMRMVIVMMLVIGLRRYLFGK